MVEVLGQQTLMGASILNFNLQLKYDMSPSTLDLNLIIDDENKVTPLGAERTYNAIDEGYHAWEVTVAPPGLDAAWGLWDNSGSSPVFAPNLYKQTGDVFWSAELGSPVWFNYYRFDKHATSATDPTEITTRHRITPQHPWYFNGILMGIAEDHSTSSGRVVNVKISDPRMILEGTQVILDSYIDTTAPADGSYGIITSPFKRLYSEGHAGFYNVLNVYGLIEQIYGFGSSDRNPKGMVWYDPVYHPNKGALDVLQTLLMGSPIVGRGAGPWQVHGSHDVGFPSFIEPVGRQPRIYQDKEYFTIGEERFGGPPYYTENKSVGAAYGPSTGTQPVGAYRYKVDLSELSFLTEGVAISPRPPGILGRDYRVNTNTVTLLGLISQICKDASADFYVELLPDASPWPPNHPTRVPVYIPNNALDFYGQVAGVIKIKVVPRVTRPEPGILRTVVEQSKRDPNHPFPGLWSGRLVTSKIGYEFGDEVMGAMILGGPLTRVVGVTELGEDIIRSEYVSPYDVNDRLREFSTYDGTRGPWAATFAATNIFPQDSGPTALGVGRKITTKQNSGHGPNLTLALGADISVEQADYRNDIWHAAPAGKPNLAQINKNAVTQSSDGKIDLFPAWGFHTRINYCSKITALDPCNAITGCTWDIGDGTCKLTVPVGGTGVPNIGFFDDTEPTKDFLEPTAAHIEHRLAGLMYTVQWVIPNCDAIPVPARCVGAPAFNNRVNCENAGNVWKPAGFVPKTGGIYHPDCIPHSMYKGGGEAGYQLHTRPRIRRNGHSCINAAGVNFNPPVDIDECLCGSCKNSAGAALPAHKSRGVCIAADATNVWTPGVYNLNTGNCTVGDATTNAWSNATGRAVLPQTARIEIDMSNVTNPTTGVRVYRFGDSHNGNIKERKYIYKATVTELRAAATSKESWISYITNFNTRLVEDMKWDGITQLVSLFQTIIPPIGGAGGGIIPGATAINQSLFEQAAEGTAATAGLNVGGARTQPLDATLATGQRLREERNAFLEAGTTKIDTMDLMFEAIKDIATNWYGKKFLMPLPYDPEDPTDHVRKVNIINATPGSVSDKPVYENAWDIAKAGWGTREGVRMNTGAGNKDPLLPYPQHPSFYEGNGNLQAFVIYPAKFRDPDGNIVTIDSSLATGSQHITLPHPTDVLYKDGGKLYVKASVDPKTYWLWEPQAGTVMKTQNGSDHEFEHNNPIHWLNSSGSASFRGGEQEFLVDIHRKGFTPTEVANADMGNSFTPLRLKPYALISVDSPMAHPKEAHNTIPLALEAERELLEILEALIPRPLIAGNLPPINVDSMHHAGADYIKAGLAPAMFKPYQAAIPQSSNRRTWGPWSGGVSFGKVVVKKDDKLSPENFGSMEALNKAAKAEVNKAIVTQQIAETGSVQLTGAPEYFAGRPIVVVAGDLGPYITGISVDTNATAGMTTTYTMKNWIPPIPGMPDKLDRIREAQAFQNAREFSRTQSNINYNTNLPGSFSP